MLLHAGDLAFYLRDKRRLAWVFKSASEQDTVRLGTVFARVAQGGGLRVGLHGAFGAGKTTFAKAVLAALDDKIQVEHFNSLREQGRWIVPGHVSLRHYDANLAFVETALPSYFQNRPMNELGLPHIDIAEYPEYDKHDKKFDCLIAFKNSRRNYGIRTMMVMPTDTLAQSPAFEDFIEDSKQYLVQHRRGEPNSIRVYNPFDHYLS